MDMGRGEERVRWKTDSLEGQQKTDSLEKTLMLGKIEGRKRKGWQRMRWLDGITDSSLASQVWASSRCWWWIGKPGVLQSNKELAWLSDWTELSWTVAHQTPLSIRNSPGENTRMGSHFLLQGILLTQGLNPCLLHCRQILYHLSHQGSPKVIILQLKYNFLFL